MTTKKTKETEATDIAVIDKPALPEVFNVAGGYENDDVRGKENIEQEDLIISRLAIAQKMSPEVDPEQEADFVEGLKVGDLFDTVTKEIYGPGPIKVTLILPVRKLAKVLDKDGKVVEWDVPWDDERCEFQTVNGQRVPPVATRFYDFLLLINDSPDFPVVLSMKRTQVPVAKALMTLMARRPGPIFAGSYTVRTVSQEGPKGIFKNYVVNPAGAAPDAVRAKAEAWYAKLSKVKFRVDEGKEVNEPSDVPF